jgi:galactokinase
MTGGGFGGSVVVLAEVGSASALADAVVAAYSERTGREGRVYVCESVDGAAVSR